MRSRPRACHGPLARVVGIALLVTALLSAGCETPRAGKRVEKFVETREVMGTWATLTLITGDGRRAVAASEAGFAALDSISALMSPHRESSEVYAINAGAADHPVPVGDATFAVLTEAQRISELSGGAFDITVGPLVDLWKQAAARDAPPDEESLAATLARVGHEKLRLDPAARTVAFAVPGMRIDLGGIAKGYAIDLAVIALQAHGIEAGIVEVGGDLSCFGTIPRALIGREADLPVRALRRRPLDRAPRDSALFQGLRRTDGVSLADPRPWPLGIQNPFAEEVLGRIWVAGGGVATSGHYRRFVTVAGRRCSHILDPRTGQPVEDPASVTILAPNALVADGLATAVTVLGADAGLALVESLPESEALIIAGGPETARRLPTAGFPELEPLDGSQADTGDPDRDLTRIQ